MSSPFIGLIESLNRPTVLCVDFDNTLTSVDSTEALFNHSAIHRINSHSSGSNSDGDGHVSPLSSIEPLTEHLSHTALTREYEEGMGRLLGCVEDMERIEDVDDLVHRVSDFEAVMQMKVERSCLLRGLLLYPPVTCGAYTPPGDLPPSLFELGQSLPLRRDACNVLDYSRSLPFTHGIDVSVYIVSLNWSNAMILGALHAPRLAACSTVCVEEVAKFNKEQRACAMYSSIDGPLTTPESSENSNSSPSIRPLHIYSSELEVELEDSTSDDCESNLNFYKTTGRILCHSVMQSVCGPVQKRLVLQHIMASHCSRDSDFLSSENQNCSVSTDRSPLLIFIGDSIGDLAAFMDADIAIVIGSCVNLLSVLKSIRFVEIAPLGRVIAGHLHINRGSAGPTSNTNFMPASRVSVDDMKPYAKPSRKVIYVTESWRDIGYVLFGDKFTSSYTKDG